MAAILSPNAKQQFFDNAGAPAASYRLYTYAANTTTPQATYTNRAGTVANTNPIILDARGEATVYLTPGVVYDYVLKTDQDAPVWTREDVVSETTPELVFASQQGVLGNGSDETAAIQAMFDAAVGKILHLEAGKTYGVTELTIPSGTALMAHGSKFKKMTTGATYGVTVEDNVVADLLELEVTGASNDAGLRITGGDVDIGAIKVVSIAADSGSGASVHGLNITGTGTRENIKVGSVYVENFVGAVFIDEVDGIDFGRIVIDTYKTGVYLRDVKNGQFNGAHIFGTAAAATGGAGENGLLIESTVDFGTENLTFRGWHIEDSAEHAFRIGGDRVVRNLWYFGCSSTNTGAIDGVSTGGAAFKVLHGNTNPTYHENINVIGFAAVDCSNSSASLNNAAAVQIGKVKGGQFTDIVIRKRNNTYSCKFGFQVQASEDIQINNPNITDCMRHSFQFIQAAAVTPAYPKTMSRVHVNGGYAQGMETANSSAVARFTVEDGTFTDVSIKGTTLAGGGAAVLHDAPTGAGAYTDCTVDATYRNPLNIAGGPPFNNPNTILINVRSQFYGTSLPNALDGSIYQDLTNGLVKIRKVGAWNTL